MKKRISAEELSAYIDGESKHPEHVRQEIQESDEVARKHTALTKLSAQVRALPEPSVRPGFAGRVIASLETPEPRSVLGWRLPVGASLAAAAALFAFIAINGLDDGVPPSVRIAVSTPAASVVSSIELEEEALVAELERRLADSPDFEMLRNDGFYEAPDPAMTLPDDLLLALAPTDWVGTFGGLEGSRDYEVAVASLNESEKDIFVQMLEDYAREETLGQSARNG